MSTLSLVIAKAGGIAKLAKLLGISNQAVSQWVQKKYIPPGRYLELHEKLNIPLEDLVNNKNYVPSPQHIDARNLSPR
ncbi:Cro/CI family transcriptional regulator [Xenorhabdus bovienii]|uniref:Phage transcriptional regulator (Modular protein) n=1 Tax=Xenorhabdus bovienii str. puntauvense TaxID=1398201 RepID=A0A077NHT2_XENBV|nr:Cro/CI family transcriptional regulator [Xenorhabdus bovienii]CDG90094.1 Phage transcriptional regulator (modular protein) [Xenorhabdus bovienii str. feltiae France]CDG91389.1 Phage transcriptional regulator (modular protein) [Xenorhabdus bovienii str. feltiae Florida]CDG97455.1 Phage transcriptional regulator (modular protein) [Xenorhabdus bovienii str. puntauvense]